MYYRFSMRLCKTVIQHEVLEVLDKEQIKHNNLNIPLINVFMVVYVL
jgi:hypothetical protein